MLVRPWKAEVGGADRSDQRADDEFISLSDITAFARQYYRTIIACVAAGVIAGWSYVTVTDPVYTARTQILIEPKLPQLLQEQGSGVTTQLDTAQIESQIAVMRSEKIAMMVIDELDLIENPDFFHLGDASLADRGRVLVNAVLETTGIANVAWFRDLVPAPPEADAAEPVADPVAPEPPEGAAAEPLADPDAPQLTEFERDRIAIAIFQRGLGISRVGVSYAVDIYFSSRNAELAAQIANAAADTFVQEQIETKAAAARQGGEWLESRLAELRTKMNTATQIAQEFRSRHDYRVRPPGAELVDGQLVFDEDEDTGREGPTLEELEVTAEAYRKMYEGVLLAFTSNLSQQSYPVADARVITAATRPLSPSHPRKKLIMAFGFVAGGMSGVGLAFMRNALDGTLRSPRQVRDQLGVVCIGELPALRNWNGGFGRLDEVAASPRSRFSESLRRAKAAMGLAEVPQPLRTIGVVSALPDEGKSVCASNLALLYAMSGRRALLVDADLDRATLSGRLAGPGGAARPSGQSRDPLAGHVVHGANHGVDLLPASAAEARGLLSPGNLEALLHELDGYDVVVFDLPALAAGADKLAIGGLLDGVVVVAEWGRTPVDLIGELVWSLQAAKAAIIGVMMTRVRRMTTKPYRGARFRGR